uniref:Uncharacterized protein n=1 Tax=Spumella elongata TaxID=89044 RepID=A0A7S3HDJ1_9STRA
MATQGGKLLAGREEVLKHVGEDGLLTLVVVPSIEEQGLDLVKRKGWQPSESVRWLIVHRGFIHNTPCSDLGVQDFKILMMHVPRSRFEAGYYVHVRGQSPYSSEHHVAKEKILEAWDEFVEVYDPKPTDNAVDIYRRFLDNSQWQEYDAWK